MWWPSAKHSYLEVFVILKPCILLQSVEINDCVPVLFLCHFGFKVSFLPCVRCPSGV